MISGILLSPATQFPKRHGTGGRHIQRIHAMLQEVEPETTLLDAHSILWIIGSGYWFEGEGARKLELVRKGELPVDDFI